MVAIGLLIVAGVLLRLGWPDSDPVGSFGLLGELPELVVDDIDIDPESGLPIVPLSTESWWWLEEPVELLDHDLRFISSAPTGEDVDTEQRRVSALVEFRDHETAVAVATTLAAAVGDVDDEAAWLARFGQTGDSGFDWLGSGAVTTPFVQVIDRWLIVSGLAYRPEYEERETAESDGGAGYQSPLIRSLRASAESILLEGDRYGEGFVAFDALCVGDAATLVPLGQDLADHPVVPNARPVWIPPGITDDDRRERRTLRLLRQISATAFARALEQDGEFTRLTLAARAAADSGDAARTQHALAELQAHVLEAMPSALPDLGPIAAALDPEVVAAEIMRMAAFAAGPVPSGEGGSSPETADDALQPRIAASTPDAWFQTGVDGGGLAIGTGTWVGIAEGLVPFVDYLAAHGCEEIRVVFHNFDDVRGD